MLSTAFKAPTMETEISGAARCAICIVRCQNISVFIIRSVQSSMYRQELRNGHDLFLAHVTCISQRQQFHSGRSRWHDHHGKPKHPLFAEDFRLGGEGPYNRNSDTVLCGKCVSWDLLRGNPCSYIPRPYQVPRGEDKDHRCPRYVSRFLAVF
jgi:hypothetical protein